MAKLQTKLVPPESDDIYSDTWMQCPMLDNRVNLACCIGIGDWPGCKYFVAASAKFMECKFQETMDWREQLETFNERKTRRT